MAASPYMRSGPHRPAPECLMHEALPQKDATHLKHGGMKPPKTKTVALPVSPPAVIAPAAILSALCCDLCLRPDLDTLRYHSSLDVTPKRDQELSCHCHDGDPPRATL